MPNSSDEKTSTSQIDFISAGLLTLGVEIELQLIDKSTLNLTPKFEELLANSNFYRKLKPEFYLSSAEINTDKCNDVHEIEGDLEESYLEITRTSKATGIEISTTGCHPFSRYSDCVITPSSRYNELIDRNQWLSRRMTVYGLHVHLGMESGDETGLAACRPTTYESLPTAGQPYLTKSWREFEELYAVLKKCQSIDSLKDLWWDIRPSPNYGTLEIRVCDGFATLSEALAITSFIHLLAHWFKDNGSWVNEVRPPASWIARENKWRAIRHGLGAEIIINSQGDFKPIGQDIFEWLEKLESYEKKLGYEKHIANLKNIINHGNSSSRQLKIYGQTNSLREVVKFNIEEFLKGEPVYS